MKTAFAVLAAAALGFSAAAAAQEGTLQKVKSSGSITIGHRDASIPFSYYDDKQQVVGYAVALCNRIVDAVKTELKMPKLETKYQLVTSANRIPLMANGTINIKQITEINGQQNLGMNIISANGHPEAFQMVETGRAVAFVMDDILLYSLAAQSRSPGDYAISVEALSVEPYGIMLRKGDAAFKKVVDAAMTSLYKSGEINPIYEKWFLKPIPPKGINLNVPMSDQFKKVIANPTDSGDPAAYK